jgi:hypothetical protein
MSWYGVQLTEAQMKQNLDGRIQKKFEGLFVKARAARDVAMFIATHPGRTFGIYFSPSTAQYAPAFLRLIGAQPCEAPTEEVTLAAGDQGTLQKLRSGQL